jgi:hypothetical protein
MRPDNRYARQAQARHTPGDLIASKSALVGVQSLRTWAGGTILCQHIGEEKPQHVNNRTLTVHQGARRAAWRSSQDGPGEKSCGPLSGLRLGGDVD